jgi:hypothetical protein
MKIIFLDIDGVLNNHFHYDYYGFEYIDSGLMDILKTIVVATEAKIVLSSTWRITETDRSIVRANLKYKNMEFIDCTPNFGRLSRSEEIKDWLNNNPQVKKFAILDDCASAGSDMEESFFKTDYYVGLTNEIAEKVINHLNKD